MEEALKSGDTEKAREVVHTTKGAAANLGGKALVAARSGTGNGDQGRSGYRARDESLQLHGYGYVGGHVGLYGPVTLQAQIFVILRHTGAFPLPEVFLRPMHGGRRQLFLRAAQRPLVSQVFPARRKAACFLGLSASARQVLGCGRSKGKP